MPMRPSSSPPRREHRRSGTSATGTRGPGPRLREQTVRVVAEGDSIRPVHALRGDPEVGVVGSVNPVGDGARGAAPRLARPQRPVVGIRERAAVGRRQRRELPHRRMIGQVRDPAWLREGHEPPTRIATEREYVAALYAYPVDPAFVRRVLAATQSDNS